MDLDLRITTLERSLKDATGFTEVLRIKLQICRFLHYKDSELSWKELQKLKPEIGRTQDELVHGWYLYNRAWFHADKGQFSESISRLEKAIEYFELTSDGIEGLAASYNGMGSCYHRMGDPEEALVLLIKAMELSDRIGDRRQVSILSLNLGALYLTKNMYEEGLEVLYSAEKYFREAEEDSLLITTYANLSIVYREIGDLDRSYEYIKTALKIDNIEGDPVQYCSILDSYVKCLIVDKKFEDARLWVNKALNVCNSNQLEHHYKLFRIYQAEIEYKCDNIITSRDILLETNTIKVDEIHLDKLEMLSKIYEALEEVEVSLSYYKEFHKEYAAIYNPDKGHLFNQNQINQLISTKQQLHIIGDIGRTLTSILNMDELTKSIYKSLKELFPIDVFGIARIKGDVLVFDMFVEDGEEVDGSIIPLTSRSSFASWVIQHSRSIIISDVDRERDFYVSTKLDFDDSRTKNYKKVQSFIYVPVIFNEEVIGVITVQSYKKKSFSISDVSLLEALESFISIALQNADKTGQLESLSTTDFLTGCYNRRKVEEEYDRIFRICRRSKVSLSIILIDIDHFKRVNDELGHDVGDIVIKSLANTLELNLHRPMDVLGRFGGEEFLVVLGDTNAEQGYLVAERIRENVEHRVINELGRTLTVSIGGTTLEAYDSRDFEPVLKRADEALYRAKGGGRNRVCWTKH